MIVKAVSMSRPVQAQEWAMRQASAIVGKHLPDVPLEKQWEISADIAEALTQTRFIFESKADAPVTQTNEEKIKSL